jgi:SAM-dependent methyltransferase
MAYGARSMDAHDPSETKSALCPAIEWAKGTPRSYACPVCGVRGEKDFVLAAKPSWRVGSFLDLLACPNCESKFFPDFEPPKYEQFDDFEAYLKFYLEIGAGIDQLVGHLFVVPLGPDARYLEIGCGFGFALDFARRALGLGVLGVDPSPFAAAGVRILGLPIITDYLRQDTDLGGGRFDLVVASEVVEHIHEPVAFLRLIARHLLPDGVLILTTPNASSAAPTTPQGILIPLLSAGWHYILYSANGLERVLRSAGFNRVEVVVRDHTLVAAATNGGSPIDLAASIDRTVFRDYLNDRRHSVQNDWLSHGLGYRLFKDLTNAGQHEKAHAIYDELKAQILASYGIDIESPHHQWLHRRAHEDFHTFALRYPMCLCGIAYFRGILALNSDNNPGLALQFFSLSVSYGDMLRAMLQELGADDAETEQIVQLSRTLRLRALAYAAPAEAATGTLELLGPDTGSPLGPQQRQAVLEIFVHLVNLGAFQAAQRLEAEIAIYLRYKSADFSSHKLHIELHRALGLIEINHRHRPANAALHFALSERAARRFHASEPEWAWERICSARHDRLLAWMVAGNAARALLAGRFFTAIPAPRPIPSEVAESATRLIAAASASTARRASRP